MTTATTSTPEHQADQQEEHLDELQEEDLGEEHLDEAPSAAWWTRAR